jgi:hypothetical protein
VRDRSPATGRGAVPSSVEWSLRLRSGLHCSSPSLDPFQASLDGQPGFPRHPDTGSGLRFASLSLLCEGLGCKVSKPRLAPGCWRASRCPKAPVLSVSGNTGSLEWERDALDLKVDLLLRPEVGPLLQSFRTRRPEGRRDGQVFLVTPGRVPKPQICFSTCARSPGRWWGLERVSRAPLLATGGPSARHGCGCGLSCGAGARPVR